MGSVKTRIESTVELALLLAYHSRPTKRGYRSPVNNLGRLQRGFVVSRGERPRVTRNISENWLCNMIFFEQDLRKRRLVERLQKAYRKLVKRWQYGGFRNNQLSKHDVDPTDCEGG